MLCGVIHSFFMMHSEPAEFTLNGFGITSCPVCVESHNMFINQLWTSLFVLWYLDMLHVWKLVSRKIPCICVHAHTHTHMHVCTCQFQKCVLWFILPVKMITFNYYKYMSHWVCHDTMMMYFTGVQWKQFSNINSQHSCVGVAWFLWYSLADLNQTPFVYL